MTQALNADPWMAFLEGFQESGLLPEGDVQVPVLLQGRLFLRGVLFRSLSPGV